MPLLIWSSLELRGKMSLGYIRLFDILEGIEATIYWSVLPPQLGVLCIFSYEVPIGSPKLDMLIIVDE